MAKTLNIVPEKDSEVENLRKSFISSRLQNDKSDRNKSLIKMLLEGTLFDLLKTVERETTTGSLKTRSVRSRDDKAFMVKKNDFDAFCTPPKLDDNIEEGLLMGQKSGFGQSKINVSSFHKELDSDFRRIDNSARTLFRAISYRTMISAFLDEAECEDDRVEGRKALINCFRSIADLTARIMANSVLCRWKVFLKNVDFSSKATEKKLLQLPIFGGQLFNGQAFDSLHTSAENLRDAREIQNVYTTSSRGGFDKNYKRRDDKNAMDTNRKRKSSFEHSSNSSKMAKATSNRTSNSGYSEQSKDNFRGGRAN
jgi:hypothetical protein